MEQISSQEAEQKQLWLTTLQEKLDIILKNVVVVYVGIAVRTVSYTQDERQAVSGCILN